MDELGDGDGDFSREELLEARAYAETGKRLDDVVATDAWIFDSFRRLVLRVDELETDLAADRSAFQEWRVDYDRLIEIEMTLKKRARAKTPIPSDELKTILTPKPKKEGQLT